MLTAHEADARFLWKNYSDYFAIGAIDITDTLAQGNRHTVFFNYEAIVKEDITPQKLQQIYAQAPDNTFPPLKIREFELVKLAEIKKLDDHELLVRSLTFGPEGNILKKGDRLPIKDAKLTFLKTDQGWRWMQ